MKTMTQIFLNQLGKSTLNLRSWDKRGFELNDEFVSPQLNEAVWQEFMLDNSSTAVNELGQLVDANGYNVLGIVLEYSK